MCPPIQACIVLRTFLSMLGSILTLWLSRLGPGRSSASFEINEIEVCLFSSQPDHYADVGHSPPTEEGDPVEEEPSISIYKRHMYLKKHGFPLWIPRPNTTLPLSYQRRGVSIGDVGIFTSDGAFDFLFNVCLPAEDTSNPDELPEGFSRLELKGTDVCKLRAHSLHSHLASPSVKKREYVTDPFHIPGVLTKVITGQRLNAPALTGLF